MKKIKMECQFCFLSEVDGKPRKRYYDFYVEPNDDLNVVKVNAWKKAFDYFADPTFKPCNGSLIDEKLISISIGNIKKYE